MHFVQAKGILSAQNGMNIYRGCTHGCIYCDSRSLCYHFTHDFEDIEVKENAPDLLEKSLKQRKEKCMIGTGSMCDPYMHIEKQLQLTRQCLEIIDRYGFGLAIQTKSSEILRDLDLLCSINRKAKCVVQFTLTTWDPALCHILEPNVSDAQERFRALQILRQHGIPTVVWLSPILPFINDTGENIQALLHCCTEAQVRGIVCFGMGVTLREGSREYFYRKLDQHFPGMKQKYANAYGNAYDLRSPNEPALMRLIQDTCTTHHIIFQPDKCFAYLSAFPQRQEQLSFL